jgi:hypothetical protein
MRCNYPDEGPPCDRCAKKSAECVIPESRAQNHDTNGSLPNPEAAIGLGSSSDPSKSSNPQLTSNPAAIDKSSPPNPKAMPPVLAPTAKPAEPMPALPPKKTAFHPPIIQIARNQTRQATVVNLGDPGMPARHQDTTKPLNTFTHGPNPVPMRRGALAGGFLPAAPLPKYVLLCSFNYLLNFFDRTHKHLSGVIGTAKKSKKAALHRLAARVTKGRQYNEEEEENASNSDLGDEDSSTSSDQLDESDNGEDSDVEDFNKVLEAIDVENDDSKFLHLENEMNMKLSFLGSEDEEVEDDVCRGPRVKINRTFSRKHVYAVDNLGTSGNMRASHQPVPEKGALPVQEKRKRGRPPKEADLKSPSDRKRKERRIKYHSESPTCGKADPATCGKCNT